MSRNGSGTYSLPAGNPVTTGTAISSTVHNTTLNDIAAEITNSVARDGQAAMTGPLDLGSQKIKNVASGTLRSDAITLGQAQDGSFLYVGTVGGSANAITLTPSPAIPAYAAGQSFVFKAAAANTGAVTVAISGLAAKNVTKRGATALASGDIPNGGVVCITYDGTQFQVDRVADVVTLTGSQTLTGKTLTSPTINTPTITSPSVSNLTDSGTTSLAAVTGNVRATQAQMEAATSNNLVVTPNIMHHHPLMPKAWVGFDGTGATGAQTIYTSTGITSVTRNATGDYTIAFSQQFSTTNYVMVGSAERNTSNGSGMVVGQKGQSSRALGFIDIITAVPGSGPENARSVNLVFFGDQ